MRTLYVCKVKCHIYVATYEEISCEERIDKGTKTQNVNIAGGKARRLQFDVSNGQKRNNKLEL